MDQEENKNIERAVALSQRNVEKDEEKGVEVLFKLIQRNLVFLANPNVLAPIFAN